MAVRPRMVWPLRRNGRFLEREHDRRSPENQQAQLSVPRRNQDPLGRLAPYSFTTSICLSITCPVNGSIAIQANYWIDTKELSADFRVKLFINRFELLIDYFAGEPIDRNVQPVPFLPFNHELRQICRSWRIFPGLSDDINH